MQLDAVDTSPAGALRPVHKPLDELLDLGPARGSSGEAMKAVPAVSRAERPTVETPQRRLRIEILYPRQILLPTRHRELQDIFASLGMYGFDHVVPEVDAIVAVDRRVVRQDAAADVDRYMRGDDGSDTAASKAPLEVDPRLGSGTVIVIDTSRNAGSEQPVSYFQI